MAPPHPSYSTQERQGNGSERRNSGPKPLTWMWHCRGTGEERRASGQAMSPGGYTPTARLDLQQNRKRNCSMGHGTPRRHEEGQAFIPTIVSKPTILEGNGTHPLNFGFSNPVLHRCLLLRHRCYYTPGMYNLFIPLCEFSALCFSYKNLKMKPK